MNKTQKYIAVIGIILIAITLFYWYSQGAEIFTKTQVLVDKTTELDRMLGVENKQYIDQFVFGLLPSGMSSIIEITSTASIAGVVVLLTGILIYLFRNKRKKTI
jgi:LPXTG-motif cell wall-anchored protein